MRSWSPSRLRKSESGCPAALAWYDAREGDLPDGARDRGVAFHRVVEAIQRAITEGRDVEAATRAILDEVVAGADVEALVTRWAEAGWADVSEVVGLELGLAVDESLELVDFGAPTALVRGILDRVEMRTEEDGTRVLVITDWKSGWATWSTLQAECYAVLGDAWAREHAPDVDAIVCQIYSPVSGHRGAMRVERGGDALETCRGRIEIAIRAARRVERAPPSTERLSSGCGWCGRRGRCTAFQSLGMATGWDPITTREGATEGAALMGALKARAADLEKELRAFCQETGDHLYLGGRRELGFHVEPGRSIEGAVVYGEALRRIGPMLEEGRPEEAARSLATMIPVGATSADSFAKRIAPRDREGQDLWKARWERETERRTWGVRTITEPSLTDAPRHPAPDGIPGAPVKGRPIETPFTVLETGDDSDEMF